MCYDDGCNLEERGKARVDLEIGATISVRAHELSLEQFAFLRQNVKRKSIPGRLLPTRVEATVDLL